MAGSAALQTEDEDPVLKAFRTGSAVSAPAPAPPNASENEDPVMTAFRTGSILDQTGKPTNAPTSGRSTGTPTGDFILHEASKYGATAKAGVRSVFDLASGTPLSEVNQRNQRDVAASTYEPSDPASKAMINTAEKVGGYIGYVPGKIFDTLGDAINNATDIRTWQQPTLSVPTSGRFAGEQAISNAATAASPKPLPTTGTGSTWLGPVVSGAAQFALGASGLKGGAPGSWAPRGAGAATAVGEDLSLVPALRRTPPTDIPSGPGANPPGAASSTPGTGTTAGPNLSVAPSAPRTMPAGAPTAAPPNLSLAPSAGRAMPAPPAPPGASLDLSVEPSAPRAMPGSAPSESGAPQPPLTATGLPRGQLWEPVDIPSRPGTPIDAEPVAGGLPAEAQASREAILKRVGLDTVRDSAVQGDAMGAATDAQMTRFDEAAGIRAKQQFDEEKAALQQHTQGMIKRAGGTIGTDEDSLNTRGQTIAAPFDALRGWFDEQRTKLYSAADERAGGAPVTKLEGVDALLQQPKFRNTLLARDQGGLLSSVENQLEEFRKQSPDGFTAQGAEQVRQWLNQVWTNDNRFAVGQLKDAIDDDVMKGAGEDIYGPARAFSQLKSQTLDNPNGIAQLFDKDPTTPLNRVTPHVKIPDTLAQMDPENFRNVLRTLHEMPAEIQPDAQAAIGEIKSHLVNKLLDAGTGKTPEAHWNAPNVSQAISKNRAKLNIAFGNDAQAVQDIRDLQSAGNILRANPTYPGAAAQAANAVKRGLMTHAIGVLGKTAGAGIGAAVTGGPWGASAGAALGEMAAAPAGKSMGERAALTKFESRLRSLSDVAKMSDVAK